MLMGYFFSFRLCFKSVALMAHLLWLCEYRYAELEEPEAVIATQDFLAFSRRRRHTEYRWGMNWMEEHDFKSVRPQ